MTASTTTPGVTWKTANDQAVSEPTSPSGTSDILDTTIDHGLDWPLERIPLREARQRYDAGMHIGVNHERHDRYTSATASPATI